MMKIGRFWVCAPVRVMGTKAMMVVLAVMLGLLALSDAARADTFNVTKTGDTDDGVCNSDCSLREAIRAANLNGRYDEVRFAPSLGGRITLTRGELAIFDDTLGPDLSISGPGADRLAVSGNDADRVFFIFSGANVTMSGLTVSDGREDEIDLGGGIYNNGALALIRSAVSGNEATFGGGIHNSPAGSLTLLDSTVSGNVASSEGGGIHNGGTLRMTNSTVSANTSANFGGGIFTYHGPANIEHSTVTGNSAVPNRGGGVASVGDTTNRTEVLSSIVSGNTGTDVDVANGPVNSFVSQGHNLIGDGGATDAFDQTGDATGVTDPALGPLQYNGGPTKTHALQRHSPAVDSAGVDCPTTDQRGAPRPQGAGCDKGAFELEPDVVAPRVVRVVPAPGTANVAPAANVYASFSEAMKASTVNRVTVQLKEKGTTRPTTATVTYSAATRKATLNPNRNLVNGATYVATVTRGAKDLSGNPLARSKVWSFTVRR